MFQKTTPGSPTQRAPSWGGGGANGPPTLPAPAGGKQSNWLCCIYCPIVGVQRSHTPVDFSFSCSAFVCTLSCRDPPSFPTPPLCDCLNNSQQVVSASSGGSGEGSCMLTTDVGTSMACPIVAGSAALASNSPPPTSTLLLLLPVYFVL